MVEIAVFDSDTWPAIWNDAAPMLKKAWERSGGRHTDESTRSQLRQGNYVLLAAIDNGVLKSACVCGVTIYPASTWLTIILCGGEDMVDWLDQGRHVLDEIAKINQCDGLEVNGRRGWVKAMDLKETGTFMERRL